MTARTTRCISMSTPRDAQADWLKHVLEDNTASPPPPLYAWTAANLPHLTKAASSSVATAAGPLTTTADASADPDDQWRRRIFILGVGNLGRLFASSLVKLRRPGSPPPPITLVVHRRELLERWHAHPGIEISRGGQVERSCIDVDVEWWTEERPVSGPSREPGKQATFEIYSFDTNTRPLLDLAQVSQILTPRVDRCGSGHLQPHRGYQGKGCSTPG